MTLTLIYCLFCAVTWTPWSMMSIIVTNGLFCQSDWYRCCQASAECYLRSVPIFLFDLKWSVFWAGSLDTQIWELVNNREPFVRPCCLFLPAWPTGIKATLWILQVGRQLVNDVTGYGKWSVCCSYQACWSHAQHVDYVFSPSWIIALHGACIQQESSIWEE